MGLVELVPTLAELESVPWRDVISTAERRECWTYSRLLLKRSTDFSSAGDEKAARVFAFLGQIASMMLRAEDAQNPLKAQVEWNTGRSARPDDVDKAEIELLAAFYPAVEDPDLRARVCDLVWILKRDNGKRDHGAARAAVDAYLESAEGLLKTAPWPYGMERLRRAVCLAALLGKSGETYTRALSRVVEAFRSIRDSGDPRLGAEVLELLLEHEAGDPNGVAAYCEKRARALEESNQTELSRQYWHISSRYRAIQGDESGRVAARQALAETYLADAARAASGEQPRPMVALHHMTRAIEAFRRLPGGRARVEEIQKKLPELEAAAMKGMGRISTPFDASEMVRQAREAVTGKPLSDALQLLAFSTGPVPIERLREEVLKSARDFPIRHLASTVSVDSAGRAIGRRGPVDPQDPAEEAVRAEMLDHLRRYRHVHVVGTVEPMRQEIAQAHQVRNSDLFFLLESNPFIEPGHEQLFLRGLKAGLEGDFVVANHLLIPQIENSLRKLLFDTGAPVTTIDEQGVQQLIGLEILLKHPLIVQILGQDAVLDLQGLLVERSSSCLRHRLAHGLLADGDFETSDAIYAWWIALRLCLVPIAYRNRQADVTRTGGGESDSLADDSVVG